LPEVLNIEFVIVTLSIAVMMFYGWKTGKTDLSGSLAGGLIAFSIYLGVGWPPLFYFLAFFLLGSLASKWQYQKKLSLDIAQEERGRRTAVHAFCNAGSGAFFSSLTFVGLPIELMHLSVAGVFAAATSDTLSSEMGNMLGSKYINILTLKEDRRGRDGVISWEGSAMGILGSAFIAGIYELIQMDWKGTSIVFFVGVISNLFDSFLGASLQRKGMLNNNTVNLLATFSAGLLGFIFGIIFR